MMEEPITPTPIKPMHLFVRAAFILQAYPISHNPHLTLKLPPYGYEKKSEI